MLQADGLKVRYRNGALGVSDVSLRVDDGQVVALFGPNGAGKTTTVRAVSGFLKTEGARVVEGSVVVDGQDLTNREPDAFTALGVAIVPERQKIFPSLTVMENLGAIAKLPPRATRARAYDEVFSLFPVLADRRKELAGRLSGGEQQMVAIGRAVLSSPRTLIVDELTLGIHSTLFPLLYGAVRAIAAEGRSVLLVDERVEFAIEFADSCAVLNMGEVVMAGKTSDLRDSPLLAQMFAGETALESGSVAQ